MLRLKRAEEKKRKVNEIVAVWNEAVPPEKHQWRLNVETDAGLKQMRTVRGDLEKILREIFQK